MFRGRVLPWFLLFLALCFLMLSNVDVLVALVLDHAGAGGGLVLQALLLSQRLRRRHYLMVFIVCSKNCFFIHCGCFSPLSVRRSVRSTWNSLNIFLTATSTWR